MFCFNFCLFYTLDYLGYTAGRGSHCDGEEATDVCLVSFLPNTYPCTQNMIKYIGNNGNENRNKMKIEMEIVVSIIHHQHIQTY